MQPEGSPSDRSKVSSGTSQQTCPHCAGTGYRIVEDGDLGRSYARTCECQREVRVRELVRLARIPRRYTSCDFESFDELNESLTQARARTREFVEGYTSRKLAEEAEFGILFLGPPGVGKTHLAVAALRTLIQDHGVVGLFVDFRDLIKTLQASYDPVSQMTEMQVLGPLFQAEVVVLDDLGASKMTEWVRDTIGHIVNSRYNDRKVTLITSNLSDESSAKESTRPSLTDRIGAAVRSRLHEMCVVVSIRGEDYRDKVKQYGRRGRSRP
jgi:DNA replication protein DnaC